MGAAVVSAFADLAALTGGAAMEQPLARARISRVRRSW